MCGIAGIVGFTGDFSEQELLQTMRHRGPDATGVWSDEQCMLFHARLKIIDLSDAALQPMVSKCGRFVMVYNGEVYNFKELSRKYHLDLRSTSDTEVLLELFARKGVECLYELNGMFAFAVWDRQSCKLTLARDRSGIKPVYYYHKNGVFAFASELKTLLNMPFIQEQRSLNRQSLTYYLHLGFVPAPYTVYTSIYKLEPAHYLEVSQGKTQKARWWNIFEHATARKIENEEHAIEELQVLLEDSVRLHLVSDVPVGCFVSGGVDSSVVTAIAAKLTNGSIRTYTIAVDDVQMSEGHYGRRVAEYLGTEHTEIQVSTAEAKEFLPRIVEIYDEPFADSSAIPTLIISRAARRYVPVVLSGDGGDELFWGYGAYRWAERLNKLAVRYFRHFIKFFLANGGQRYRRASWLFDYDEIGSTETHIFSQEQYLFSAKELERFGFRVEYDGLSSLRELEQLRWLKPSERQSLFDLLYYLPDDLLVKVDRASMAFSLETRVPLLDYRLVEYALRLSPQMKCRHGITKYVLKKVLYRYLPEDFFARPKRGFSVPLRQWLRNDFYSYVQMMLHNEDLKDLLDCRPVDIVAVRRWNAGDDLYYNRVWQLVVLSQFLQKHKELR